MRKFFLFVLIALCVAFTGNAHAISLTNGDFDTDVGLTGNGWAVFNTIPGWTSYSGAGIEVERGTVVTPHSGPQYVELDSHNNSAMYQQVSLVMGWYDLVFYYQPRTGNVNDNGINFGVMDLSSQSVFADSVDATTGTWQGWQMVSTSFEIQSDGDYKLYFAAFGDYGKIGGNSLGGFIDTVSLDASPVPEPGTFVLMGFGLVGLLGLRRKLQK